MKYRLVATLMTMAFVTPAIAEDAVCYNCPPQWADWASMLEAIDKEIDVQMPHDNKNSGQTLSQLLAEKANPIADVAYYGVTTGIKAGNEGVATAYKPTGFEDIPDGLKDPEGKWFAIHYGTLGFFVNVDALGGAAVPQCFADLTKSEYRGMVGYLDPSSAFVGYAGAVAANIAFGGDLSNFDPAIKYFNDVIKAQKKYKTPNQLEKLALEALVKTLEKCTDEMSPEDIQTLIYSTGKENGYADNLRDWFKLIYEVVFGDENGPRMGFFISFFGVKETTELLMNKLK